MEIIPFTDEFASDFSRLNLAWVEKYFEVEKPDREMLGNPRQNIIDKGGYIFFARSGGTIAGTFALLKNFDNEYELSKMAVSEEHQGQKIGNRMLDFCIEKAKALQATRIILYSNTMLLPAIHLYKKYGFVEVPNNNSEYKRSNIKMALELK